MPSNSPQPSEVANRPSLAPIIAGIVAVLVLLIGGGVWYASSISHSVADHKGAYDQAYRAHALGAPFVLQSATWDSATSQWRYVYTAAVAGAAAVAAVQQQFSTGGYQVNANRPDVSAADRGSLYRDLITGNISLNVAVTAASGATYATGPSVVTVDVAGLSAP